MLTHERRQAGAVEVLEDEVRPRAVELDTEPAHDRRVGEVGQHLRLAFESPQGGRVVDQVRAYDLDHDRGVEDLVEREVRLVRGPAA